MDTFKRASMTRHHVLPISHGGTNVSTNILYKPEREHRAYHVLFENKTPEEIIELLISGNFQLHSTSQWEAWRILFDHMGPVEAAGIIKEEWTKEI